MDALELARSNRDKQVVFFAVGFETTAPATAMAVYQARATHVENFSMLAAHVRVPPALEAILSAPGCAIDGFLAAGHVCTIMGWREYEPISARHRVPIVVTGFEPVDLLQGVLMCVRRLEAGRPEVVNQYTRAVTRDGNRAAQALMGEVFAIAPRLWRGIGTIGAGGLLLRSEFAAFDAEVRFADAAAGQAAIAATAKAASECMSGQVLQGLCKPADCPAFATRCTPLHPLGATMVSSEGACAAYYRYRPRD
jgi:hydrogenase expression/formation protein HypD